MEYTQQEALYMLEGDTTVYRGFLVEDPTLMRMIANKVPYETLLKYAQENW